MSDVEEVVVDFINGKLLSTSGQNTASLDSRILEDAILDSLGLQQLITFLEGRYAIKIKDEHLSPENFESPRSIARLVEELR